MGGFKRVEDRPTPPEVYNWRTYLMASQIAWGAMTFGYDGAFIGTTITQTSYQKAFGLDKMSTKDKNNVSSNITSLFSAGAFFGALFLYPSNELLGRKRSMQIGCILFLIGGIISFISTHSIGIQYAARVLTGFGCGCMTAVVPTYLSELSPPGWRGQLTGLFEIAYQVGSVIGFWINYGIKQHIASSDSRAWRIPMAIQIVPAIILLFVSFFFIETPAWLIKTGKRERAIKNLVYLRRLPADHPYVQQDVAIIEDQIEHEKEICPGGDDSFFGYVRGAFKELSLPGMRNRVLQSWCMFMLQNFSGAAAINYYSPSLFAAIGISNVTLYTGIYGLIKAIGSIVFYVWFIDRWGRRQPWLVSSMTCSICMLYLGIFGKVGNPSAHTNPLTSSTSYKAASKGGIASVMLFAFFWSFGANGLPWVISADIYPLRVRSICASYYAMLNWLWGFVITKALPSMETAMKGYGVFFFFFGCLMLAFLYGYVFIFETKGLSPPEIDVLYGFVGEDTRYAKQIKELSRGDVEFAGDHNKHNETKHEEDMDVHSRV